MNTQSEDTLREFVIESERIAGFDLPEGSDPFEKSTWPHAWREHFKLATILESAHRYVPVELVNATLLDTHGELRIRTGRLGHDLNAPGGHEVKDLLAEWNRVAEAIFDKGVSEPDELWKMHDELLCLRAFTTGNSRTARLMLNHLRVRCGLPWEIVRLEDRGGYFENVDHYRRTVFIPKRAILRAA